MKPKSFRSSSLFLGSSIILCISAGAIHGQTVIPWNGAVASVAAGAWGTDTNWTGLNIPDAVTEQADLRKDWSGTAPTLTLGADRTINGVLFDDTGATGDVALTINTGNTLTLAGTSPVLQVDAGTLTLANVLGGSTDWAKTGAGVLTLNGTNTYTGLTTITGGVVTVGNNTALGSNATGTVVNTGTSLRFSASRTISEPLTLSGVGVGTNSGAIQSNGGTAVATLNGAITLAADTNIKCDGGTSFIIGSSGITAVDKNLSFQLDNGANSSVAGPIALGTGGLTKTSGSMLSINGANTYSGPTLITGGTLSVGGSILDTSSIVANNSTLLVNAGPGIADRVADTLPINLNFGGALSLTGNGTTDTLEKVGVMNVAGTGSFTVTSPTGRISTLELGEINRTTDKATLLVRGTNLNQASSTEAGRIVLGDGGASLPPMVGSATLINAAATDTTQAVKILPCFLGDVSPTGTGSGFVTYDTVLGLRVLTADQSLELTAPYVTAGSPDNATVSANLTLDNASGVTVNSLLFKTAAAALDSTAVNPLTINSGAIATSGNFAFTIGSGFSEVFLGNGDGYITVPTNTLTINSTVNGGNLTKAGGGSLVLAADNTYTGKTTVNAGTLSFSTIGNVGGGATSLGAPITPANGTIDATGTLTYTGIEASSDRILNLISLNSATNVQLFNSGTGLLSLTGGVTGTGTLFVRGDGADIEISGLISVSGGIAKTESKTLFLTNPANNFTGAITVNRGIVSISSIENGGINSVIGSGNSISLGQSGFNNTGILQFTGASGGSTNRPINIQSNTGNTNGGIIENTVAGQTLTLSGNITSGGTGTTPTFVVRGDGDGLLSGNISGTGLSVTKGGTGTWAFIGVNTATGATGVTEGLFKFNGTTQALAGLSLGGGPSGTTATLGTPADTINLGGNVTYSATNNPNGAFLSAGTLNLGGLTRTVTVGNSSAAANDLTINSEITNGNLTKAGAGVLLLPRANTFTGLVQINGTSNGNTLRIEHAEALGPVSTVKNVNMTGSNRQFSILELANNITVDINKTIGAAGKSYLGVNDLNAGSPVFLRNASGNNTWLGNILINNSGGGYSIESASGTLTIGNVGTASLVRNDVASSSRTIEMRGAGDIVIHSQVVANGASITGINKLGTGTLTLPRTDNTCTAANNFAVGTTVVESMANGGLASSIGAGTTFNVGGTLRHVGSANSSSNRAFGLVGTNPTIESSGSGTLALTSATAVAYQLGSGTTVDASNAGDSVLTCVDMWSLFPGLTIAGTGIATGTKITSVDYDARQITLDTPTTVTTQRGANFSASATTNAGQNTLQFTSANASLPNLVAGMSVTGTGIAAGSVITAINTTSGLITLNNNLTANVTTSSGAISFNNTNTVTISGTSNLDRTLTLGGTNTGDNLLASPMSNPAGTGKLNLVKANAGKWILAGNSSHSGTTAIDSGTLLVNGIHSGASTYTVASGATLGGIGSIASSITIDGTLAPGASIEDLATGALSFSSGSTLAIEINTATATADQLVVTGNVDLTGTVNLALTDLGGNVALTPGTKLTLVDYSGVWDDTDLVHYLGAPVTNGSNITLGANTFTVDYSDDTLDGTAMTLTAVAGSASPFTTWMDGFTAQLPNAADRLPEADPDKDGNDNLLEFALDGNPADGSNNGKMLVKTDDSGDAGTDRDLTLTLAVRNGAALGSGAGGSATLTVDGIVYTIQGSAGLEAWDKAISEVAPAFTLSPAPSAGWTTRTFQVGDSNTLPGKRFIRVGVQ